MGRQQESKRERIVAAAALESIAGKTLVDELRNVKLAAGLSFARLESFTPYSRASLERYINGKLFPSRDAVIAIAKVCKADASRLVRLWECAAETGATSSDGVDDRKLANRPESDRLLESSPPPFAVFAEGQRRRFRWPAGRFRRAVLLISGLSVAVMFGVFGLMEGLNFANTNKGFNPNPPSGCRDYYVDFRAYILGRLCWTKNTVMATGLLDNRAGPGPAAVQLCLSKNQDSCNEPVDIAAVDSGQMTQIERTVRLRPGYSAWIRVCVIQYCSQWD